MPECQPVCSVSRGGFAGRPAPGRGYRAPLDPTFTNFEKKNVLRKRRLCSSGRPFCPFGGRCNRLLSRQTHYNAGHPERFRPLRPVNGYGFPMIATRRIRSGSRGPVPPLENLERGDVAQRGEHVGIIAGVSADRVLLWPVRWRNAERVGDIPVTGWLDTALLGNPRQAMIQASVLMDVPRDGQRRLGRLTDSLLDQVERAAARDADTSAAIRRWTGEREHRRDECVPPPKAL